MDNNFSIACQAQSWIFCSAAFFITVLARVNRPCRVATSGRFDHAHPMDNKCPFIASVCTHVFLSTPCFFLTPYLNILTQKSDESAGGDHLYFPLCSSCAFSCLYKELLFEICLLIVACFVDHNFRYFIKKDAARMGCSMSTMTSLVWKGIKKSLLFRCLTSTPRTTQR